MVKILPSNVGDPDLIPGSELKSHMPPDHKKQTNKQTKKHKTETIL